MELIINKDDFRILKDKITPHIFIIKLNIPNKMLINSLKQVIIGATVATNYKYIRFRAFSIKTFQQFKQEQENKNSVKNLRIYIVAKLFINLASQLKYLISTHEQSFIGFSPENIIVLDDNKFIYISNEHLTSVKNNMIELTFPFTMRDFFLSPEQTKITVLPSQIHFKTAYYSLASLIIDTLLPYDVFNQEEEIHSHESIIQKLDNSFIKDTSFYNILKRCLVEEAKERRIIFI
jgi:hypothetical protein